MQIHFPYNPTSGEWWLHTTFTSPSAVQEWIDKQSEGEEWVLVSCSVLDQHWFAVKNTIDINGTRIAQDYMLANTVVPDVAKTLDELREDNAPVAVASTVSNEQREAYSDEITKKMELLDTLEEKIQELAQQEEMLGDPESDPTGVVAKQLSALQVNRGRLSVAITGIRDRLAYLEAQLMTEAEMATQTQERDAKIRANTTGSEVGEVIANTTEPPPSESLQALVEKTLEEANGEKTIEEKLEAVGQSAESTEHINETVDAIVEEGVTVEGDLSITDDGVVVTDESNDLEEESEIIALETTIRELSTVPAGEALADRLARQRKLTEAEDQLEALVGAGSDV